ncbi:MAG: hypothetical protein PHI85_04980 [Victivallaceae bacterium]|nr:hypothetical protein [Victivallaceae bacterium]
MTKQEIYDELKSDGAKLKAINFVSEETLADIYFDRFGRKPEDMDDTAVKNCSDSSGDNALVCEEKIRTLKFSESGWCPELGRSYFAGIYRPKTIDEYFILRKYAAREL